MDELPFYLCPDCGTLEEVFNMAIEEQNIQAQLDSMTGDLLFESIYEALPQLTLSIVFLANNNHHVMADGGSLQLSWAVGSAVLSFLSLVKGIVMGITSVRGKKSTVNLVALFSILIYFLLTIGLFGFFLLLDYLGYLD